MEFHPLCLLLSYREEVVNELSELMTVHGWYPQEHITVYKGQILDGRHRYLAAQKADVKPQFMNFEGDTTEAVAFVFGVNAMSRHFSNADKKDFFFKAREEGFWPKREVGATRATDEEDTESSLSNQEIAGVLGVNIGTITNWEKERTAPTPIRADTNGEIEWYTPVKYIDMARNVMDGIDLDPASCAFAQKNIKASTFYGKEDDGLDQAWAGRVWLNPPYAKGIIEAFAEKIQHEYLFGAVTQAIVLTHNFTDTAWFHGLAAHANAICFTRGRIKFYNEDGEGNSPTSGHVFFYFGMNTDRFIEEFEEIGSILMPR